MINLRQHLQTKRKAPKSIRLTPLSSTLASLGKSPLIIIREMTRKKINSLSISKLISSNLHHDKDVVFVGDYDMASSINSLCNPSNFVYTVPIKLEWD